MKNRFFMCLFIFVLCFVFVGSVRAEEIEKICFYSGQINDETINTHGTEKGNQTFAVAIEYSCNVKNDKCTSEYAAGYTDSNEESKTISFGNASDVFGSSTSKYIDKFYKDKKISCPNSVVINGNVANGVYFSYDCPKGKAANGECIGVGTIIPSSSVPSGDSLADKVKNVTDLGHYNGNFAVTPTNPDDDDKNEDEDRNKKYIDSIKERAGQEVNNGINNGNSFDDLKKNNSCSALLGSGDNSIAPVIKNVFLVTCVIGVVILLFTASGDFIKAITSGENDAVAVAFKNSKNRIIATLILLLLPVVLNFIIDIINNNVVVITDSEGNKTEVKIGNVSDCNIVD